MRLTALPITAEELAPTADRVVWDREGLYREMVGWGDGMVVPARDYRRPGRDLRRAVSHVARIPDRVAAWRASGVRRRLRDVGQVEPIVVDPAVELVYGHIALPASRPERPVLWSTNGVVEDPVGWRPPEQSGATHSVMAGRASRVQCWSEVGRQGMLRWGDGIDADRIVVVPPLVSVDLPAPVPEERDDVVAIFVGGDGRLKGLDVVLRAAASLGPGLRLEVVTGDLAPTDLPSSVTWLGLLPRRDVLAHLVAADLLVFPSRVESFGMVALEALAAGTPQVVHRGGVPAEIAGPSGIEVDGADPSELASAIETLAGDGARRQGLISLGRDRYRSTYHPTVVGPQLESLIHQV